MVLEQDNATPGAFIITWPSYVIWSNKEIYGPQINQGGKILVTLTTVNGGTTWMGSFKSYLSQQYTYYDAFVEANSPNDQTWWVGGNKYLTYLYLYTNITASAVTRGKKIKFENGGYGIICSYSEEDANNPWNLTDSNSIPIKAILSVVMPFDISTAGAVKFRITDIVIDNLVENGLNVLCGFPSPPGNGWAGGVDCTIVPYDSYTLDDTGGTLLFDFGISSLTNPNNPSFSLPLPININEPLYFGFTDIMPISNIPPPNRIITSIQFVSGSWQYLYDAPAIPNSGLDPKLARLWFPVSNESV